MTDAKKERECEMAPAEDVAFSALCNWGEAEAAAGAGDKSQQSLSDG